MGGKGEGPSSSVPVQIPLLALPRGANTTLLCPHARGQLAAGWQSVPSMAWGDGAAEPCHARSASVPSPRLDAGVQGEATVGYGFTVLSLGLLMAHELFASVRCCQGTARVLVPSTKEHL